MPIHLTKPSYIMWIYRQTWQSQQSLSATLQTPKNGQQYYHASSANTNTCECKDVCSKLLNIKYTLLGTGSNARFILLPLCTVFRIHNYAKIHHLHNTCKRSVATPLAISQFIFKTTGQSNIAADMNTFDLTEIMQTNNLLYDKYEVIPLYVIYFPNYSIF